MAEPGEDLTLRSEVEVFLFEEAAMLDDNRLRDWLALLESDVTYRAPVRQTRERAVGPGFSDRSFHFRDDYETLATRVLRLETEYAWAEDPPSRTRRLISNVLLGEGDPESGQQVRSAFILYRGRMDTTAHQLLVGERRDVLRRRGNGSFGLAARTVLFDHTTLPTHNLAVLV